MSRSLLVLLPLTWAFLATDEKQPVRIPGPLEVIEINENHPTMSPVRFSHLVHIDPAVIGRTVECVECHHTLSENPGQIPAACTTCHPHVSETAQVDESQPHEHSGPPDL